MSALQTVGEALAVLFIGVVLPGLLFDLLFPSSRAYVRPNPMLQSMMKFRWPFGPIGRKAKEPPSDDTSVKERR